MIMYFVFVLLFTTSEAGSLKMKKMANEYSKKLANEIVDVKINIEYVKKPMQYDFNVTNCPLTKSAQCVLCKEHVVVDEEYCDNPKTEIEKCLCLASNHHWRTMYENVEDKLQTVSEVCKFVCEEQQINSSKPPQTPNSPTSEPQVNTTKTGLLTNNSNKYYILLFSVALVLIL